MFAGAFKNVSNKIQIIFFKIYVMAPICMCMYVYETGTETDRFWKMTYGPDVENIELTIHLYNHNKPKDKKRVK